MTASFDGLLVSRSSKVIASFRLGYVLRTVVLPLYKSTPLNEAKKEIFNLYSSFRIIYFQKNFRLAHQELWQFL
jgi:hypothetical protein